MTAQNKISLSGKWFYVPDSSEEKSIDEIASLLEKGSLPQMNVPSNWELQGLHNFNGSVWFVKSFTLSNTQGISILKFYGVDYFTDVWLNGNYVGSHEGYFQQFYFNISDFINTGENLLIVKVSSPLEEPETVWPYKKNLIKGIFNHHDCRPGAWDNEHGQDMNTGGIWNKVEIEYGSRIYIDGVKITPSINEDFSKALIYVELNYESSLNHDQKIKVSTELTAHAGVSAEKEFTLLFKPGKGTASFTFSIKNPELWWSWDFGAQNLYNLKISSEYFSYRKYSFGIKKVKLDEEKQFFINDKKLFLRGTNIIPTQYLSELSTEKIHQQVSLMREANINVVRVHAHVNCPEFYDECDRQGIMVWQDFALQWTYNESEEFISNAVSQIKDMVKLHYNHPSIVFWCCHNEPGEQINTLDNFLYDAVLSEDNSRIIRKASNYEEHPYDGWYWGKAEHYEAAPMGPLVTEFGAQALPVLSSLKKFIPDDCLFPPEYNLWRFHDFQFIMTFLIANVSKGNSIEEFIENSQNYQAYLLRTAIDSYRRKKHHGITGIFQFMFIDCWPSITWSIVDYYGVKKKGYNVVKKAFQPLYLSVKLRQEKYFPEDKLNLDLWLINDLHKEFSNCKIIIRTGEEVLREFDNMLIPSDSIHRFNWETLGIKLTKAQKPGKHLLIFQICDNTSNTLLSDNEAEIEIVSESQIIEKKIPEEAEIT